VLLFATHAICQHANIVITYAPNAQVNYAGCVLFVVEHAIASFVILTNQKHTNVKSVVRNYAMIARGVANAVANSCAMIVRMYALGAWMFKCVKIVRKRVPEKCFASSATGNIEPAPCAKNTKLDNVQRLFFIKSVFHAVSRTLA
jgi:hypothetical protein